MPHSTSNQAALDKILQLEAQKAAPLLANLEGQEETFEVPKFIEHLNDINTDEETEAHFKCIFEPKNDPNLKIAWFLNDKEIACGSRIVANEDFGVAKLDLMGVQKSDEGVISCRAVNSAGSASTNGTLKVKASNIIVSGTLHPTGESGLVNVTKADQKLSDSIGGSLPDPEPVEEKYGLPVFINPLPDSFLNVKNHLHMECTVEPRNDPNLTISWYLNGLPLSAGSRISPKLDFGLVTLDVSDVTSRDQGVYTCKAVNNLGEGVTFTSVEIPDDSQIDAETKHPSGTEGFQAISNVDIKFVLPDDAEEQQDAGKKPEFVQPLNDVNATEGSSVVLQAKLDHHQESNIDINWLLDGKPLLESSRYKKVNIFGMVILEIGNVSSTDAGKYTCIATNKFGAAQCDANLKFHEEKSAQCPKFLGKLEDQMGLVEGQSLHLQCALEPVNDDSLKVEWLLNGMPMKESSRIKSVCDFGFVMLDVSCLEPRDTGNYTCRAWNKYGEDKVFCNIECGGTSGVQAESLQPKSLSKITLFETGGIDFKVSLRLTLCLQV